MSNQNKQLYRSRDQRMVGGVCAGLGEFFGIDPTFVRLAFVFGALAGWMGALLLTYLVMLIVVPEEPLGYTAAQPTPPVPIGDE